MDNSIRIKVISDVSLYREGIISQLKQFSDLDVQGISSADLNACTDLISATAILIDVSFPDLQLIIDGIRTQKLDTKIVVLNLFDQPSTVLECAQKGVEAFISKSDDIEELTRCIYQVIEGSYHYNSDITQLLLKQINRSEQSAAQHHQLELLTHRQSCVLQLLESGKSNKEIAKTLGIEVTTVKNHVHTILDKLQVHSRCEAAALFRRYQSPIELTAL